MLFLTNQEAGSLKHYLPSPVRRQDPETLSSPANQEALRISLSLTHFPRRISKYSFEQIPSLHFFPFHGSFSELTSKQLLSRAGRKDKAIQAEQSI